MVALFLLQTSYKNLMCCDEWLHSLHFFKWDLCPLFSTSFPLSTYPSIHTLLSYPLFPYLLCFHVLLHICNIRTLSCYRTLYDSQVLALIHLLYLLSGAKLRQTERTRNACLLWVFCLPGFCRTACGSHCGPKLSSPPCSMPPCSLA